MEVTSKFNRTTSIHIDKSIETSMVTKSKAKVFILVWEKGNKIFYVLAALYTVSSAMLVEFVKKKNWVPVDDI